jgi:hypothetical protein
MRNARGGQGKRLSLTMKQAVKGQEIKYENRKKGDIKSDKMLFHRTPDLSGERTFSGSGGEDGQMYSL